MVEGPGHFHWAPRRDEDDDHLRIDGPSDGDAGAPPPPPPPPGGTTYDWAVPHGPNEPDPAPSRPPAPPVLSITLAVLALVIGVLLVLDTVDAIEVSALLVAATSFVVIATGLVVAAFVGRVRGLVVLTVLAGLGLVAAPVADMVLDDGIADRVVRIHDPADLEDEYRLGIGNLTVDLRSLDPADLDRAIDVAVGIGRAEVIVPEDVRVRVDGEATAGYVELFDRSRDGGRVSLVVNDGPDSPHTLVIDADVTFGAIEVRRA